MHKRVTSADGRHIVLGISASKSPTSKSAHYTGTHRSTGDFLSIRKQDNGWYVRARVRKDSPNAKYAEPGGWVTLAAGLSSLAEAANYAR